MGTPRTYPEIVQEALGVLPETGVVSRDDVATLLEFNNDLVNLLNDEGLEWRGHSYRNKGWCVLMVMKVSAGKAPQVSFITERDTTACMRVFLRKLRAGTLAWVLDKYG